MLLARPVASRGLQSMPASVKCKKDHVALGAVDRRARIQSVLDELPESAGDAFNGEAMPQCRTDDGRYDEIGGCVRKNSQPQRDEAAQPAILPALLIHDARQPVKLVGIETKVGEGAQRRGNVAAGRLQRLRASAEILGGGRQPAKICNRLHSRPRLIALPRGIPKVAVRVNPLRGNTDICI